MGSQRDGLEHRFDREHLFQLCVVPGLATIGAMIGVFLGVTAVLMMWETAITGRLWTRIFALGVMYLLPPFSVGMWMGRRHQLVILPPIVIGLTPIIAGAASLALFGGPVGTIVERPLLVVAAIGVWSGVAAIGVYLGAKLWGRDSSDSPLSP